MEVVMEGASGVHPGFPDDLHGVQVLALLR